MNKQRVAAVLSRLVADVGFPAFIAVDHGPEFDGWVLAEWAYRNHVRLARIRPGKRNENAPIEYWKGRFRNEHLNEDWSTGL